MLIGENIILRPLKLSDWEKTIQWRNNITIKQMAMMHPFPITEMVEKEWYENIMKSKSDRTIYFTITKKNDEPIGFVTLNNVNYIHRNCYLGIVIGDPSAQGMGFGTETMKLILVYAFNTLNLNKVLVEVTDHNTNAVKLYDNLGFTLEGRLKKHYYSEGNYMDVLVMSLFKQNG